ncbi:MAG: hypothetical protein L0H36_02395 [bacterium]|nr:hypothetical protein [bacterium]
MSHKSIESQGLENLPPKPTFTPNEGIHSTEKDNKNPNKKHKFGKGIAGVTIAVLAAGGGIGGYKAFEHFSNDENEPSTSADKNPGEDTHLENSNDQEQAINTDFNQTGPELDPTFEEAKDKWVDTWGYKFDNPEAAFYAENAYSSEQNAYGAIAMEDEFYDSPYDFPSEPTGETGFYGMNRMQFPENTDITAQSSKDYFNGGIAPNLQRYLNLTARNTDQDDRDKVYNDYRLYIGGEKMGPNDIQNNNPDTLNLNDQLVKIADKYGPDSNFEIAPAKLVKSGNGMDKGSSDSIFYNDKQPQTEIDDSGEVTSFSNEVTIVVKVQTFNDKNMYAENTEILKNVDLSVARIDDDPSYVSVGIK